MGAEGHTTLRVRLSGHEVLGKQGQLDAYEVITEDVTKQRQLEDHLREQAARDPLTGLANYRHLAEVLAMEVKRSERTGREFALLLFDVDGLKQINDRYGHLTGSHALCRVADVLSFCRTSIRRRATAGRVCSCVTGNRRRGGQPSGATHLRQHCQ